MTGEFCESGACRAELSFEALAEGEAREERAGESG